MSSDITSSAPKKRGSKTARKGASAAKAPPPPVTVWTAALDRALDEAETEWITTVMFGSDDRFATVVDGPDGPRLKHRHPTGLQHAVGQNLFGLHQSRRAVPMQVPCREGHLRTRQVYAYPLWRIYRLLGIEDPRTPKATPPVPREPLRQSVQFTSPAPDEGESPAPPPIPRQRPAPSLEFIPPLPRADSELETCGADSC